MWNQNFSATFLFGGWGRKNPQVLEVKTIQHFFPRRKTFASLVLMQIPRRCRGFDCVSLPTCLRAPLLTPAVSYGWIMSFFFRMSKTWLGFMPRLDTLIHPTLRADVMAVKSVFKKNKQKTVRHKLWRIRKIKLQPQAMNFYKPNSQNCATIMFESNNFTYSRWRKEAEKQTARSKKSTAKSAEPYEHRINRISRATSAYANQLCSDLSILYLQGRADI